MKTVADLSGEIFGDLEVISKAGRSSWNCRCICGNIVTIYTSLLLNSGRKSCGCANKRQGKDSRRWSGYEDISNRFWGRLKYDAKDRNIEFNITIEECWNKFILQNKKCGLTGDELSFELTKEDVATNTGTASIDRLDSSFGYTDTNIWWIHKNLNMMKSNFSKDYFIELCNLVINNNDSETNIEINNKKHAANWTGYGNVSGLYISNVERGAKRRGFNFEITAKDVWEKYVEQGGRCAITNLPLIMVTDYSKDCRLQSASIDRITP